MSSLKQQFVLAAAIALTPVAAAAQATSETARTGWSDPSPGGIFDCSSITPVQRPADLVASAPIVNGTRNVTAPDRMVRTTLDA